MRAFFVSVLPPVTASPPLRPLHHPVKPLSHLYLPRIKISLARWTSRIQSIRVLKEAVEVETGATEEVSEGGSELGVNGFPLETKEDGLDSPPKVSSRKKKKRPEESDSGYDRYKLRNGREVFEEKAYLVGVECKGSKGDTFGIEESLEELAQLADTAGLLVVGSTYQKQLRNLEKVFGGDVRVCDRTALILDIFNQRAATHEAALQVSLAQMEYQLPRLTKMWAHLERQAGGKVKGMGEKQIEVDKRILRTQIGELRKELESVRKHRKQYRNRRLSVPVPVVSLVGYTNAGKSTLLNHLTGAEVLAEDQLFATLDPTTRRVQMKNGNEFLLTDTVGFIQKLPTMLVAAFRATLEEISESSLLVHVVDISHPLAQQQMDAVDKVLQELDVASIPKLVVWNKVDKTDDPQRVKTQAEKQGVICISAINGDGLEQFCNAIQTKLKDSLVPVEAFVPYDKGMLLNTIHQVGMVEETERIILLGNFNSKHFSKAKNYRDTLMGLILDLLAVLK
ncbi:GTPase HflX-like isoform X5 [Phoenix dactylifera]|uniref:GTPase HflX-like isoform X5 n=1 Tax=Phoenix dactylifera TaxID=42345 RepID=A0A8B8ZPQ2_PHODC|nr:GTPase HflX-like isoform X5 [Phoenix dactylifera]